MLDHSAEPRLLPLLTHGRGPRDGVAPTVATMRPGAGRAGSPRPRAPRRTAVRRRAARPCSSLPRREYRSSSTSRTIRSRPPPPRVRSPGRARGRSRGSEPSGRAEVLAQPVPGLSRGPRVGPGAAAGRPPSPTAPPTPPPAHRRGGARAGCGARSRGPNATTPTSSAPASPPPTGQPREAGLVGVVLVLGGLRAGHVLATRLVARLGLLGAGGRARRAGGRVARRPRARPCSRARSAARSPGVGSNRTQPAPSK